jgi:hypothetical protein
MEAAMTDAATIARALGGKQCANGGYVCRCPVPGHGNGRGDRRPSLSIRDGDQALLVHCHAGCDQRDVIEALGARGLWQRTHRHNSGRHRGDDRIARIEADTGVVKRTQAALRIWQASRPAEETPVETYLRSRGLSIPVPPSVRFHSGLKHPSGGIWPVMVALVTNGADGTPLAIHRTFLGRDGGGKASVEPQKMMLGPCRGGVVRLAEPTELLMVGEGIETCLAAIQATGHPAWAALSTSGLRSLELPNCVRDVVVLADGDDPGEEAAQACAGRRKREGRRVRIARPPRGMDFNDLTSRSV